MQERRIALSSDSAVAKAVQQEFGHQAKKPGSSPMRCPTREGLLTLDLSGSQSLPRHTLVTRLSDLSRAQSIYRKSNTERAVGALIKLEGQIRHKSKHRFRFFPHGSLTKKDALEDRAKRAFAPQKSKFALSAAEERKSISLRCVGSLQNANFSLTRAKQRRGQASQRRNHPIGRLRQNLSHSDKTRLTLQRKTYRKGTSEQAFAVVKGTSS